MSRETAPTLRQMLHEDAPLFVLWSLTLVLTAAIYPSLPAEIPIHWNEMGEADGWASKAVGAWMTPGLVAATYALTLLSIRVDPRRKNHGRSPATLRLFRVATPVFLIALHLTMQAVWLGAEVDLVGLVFAGTGALFAVLGNVMGRLPPNYFLGIRVPWTLASDVVWKRTHRLAGQLWFVGGIALLFTPWLPPAPRLVYFVTIVAVVSVAPVAAAYAFHRAEPR